MGLFGSVMMWLCHRAIHRRSDVPPLFSYLRTARRWEIVVMSVAMTLMVAALVVPWSVTGSPVAGILTLTGLGLVGMVVFVPVSIVVAVRHPDGMGHRWDDKG